MGARQPSGPSPRGQGRWPRGPGGEPRAEGSPQEAGPGPESRFLTPGPGGEGAGGHRGFLGFCAPGPSCSVEWALSRCMGQRWRVMVARHCGCRQTGVHVWHVPPSVWGLGRKERGARRRASWAVCPQPVTWPLCFFLSRVRREWDWRSRGGGAHPADTRRHHTARLREAIHGGHRSCHRSVGAAGNTWDREGEHVRPLILPPRRGPVLGARGEQEHPSLHGKTRGLHSPTHTSRPQPSGQRVGRARRARSGAESDELGRRKQVAQRLGCLPVPGHSALCLRACCSCRQAREQALARRPLPSDS